MVGQVIGNYRVVRELARGGMSTIFEAVHAQIGRRAVIKLLDPALCQDPQIVQRFFNEARAASAIDHRGVVEIFESGQLPGGGAYLIMEYIRGGTLGDRLRQRGRLPLAEALRLARQVAPALRAAHDKGIVHRDLKPDNVMLATDPDAEGGERVKLLDFGVAKLRPEQQGEGEAPVQTRTGTLMGTPEYMAPEQIYHSRGVDAKADVYSLGVMLYAMLSGQLPFTGDWTSVIMMHLHSAPAPLRALVPDTPRELAALVHGMLAKGPADRPTMATVVAGLTRAEHRLRLQRFFFGPGRYVVAALLTVLTALVVVLCFRPAAQGDGAASTVSDGASEAGAADGGLPDGSGGDGGAPDGP